MSIKPSLLKISNLSEKDILHIFKLAFAHKKQYDDKVRMNNILQGKPVALVFEKPSLRTKVAFEVAVAGLGGIPVYLTGTQIFSLGKKDYGRESVADIAHNLERFCDLIVARVFSHKTLEALEKNLSVPLINALCDQHHPTQALADIMTVIWHKKDYKGLKLVFIGDGNNVATSLMEICAILGINFTIASPKKYSIPKEKQKVALSLAEKSGAKLAFLESPEEAIKNADIVYTDTFVSMGAEEETVIRHRIFSSYQVNMKLFKKAKKDAIFLHCLPAHRGIEVTDEVIDDKRSKVFDLAECRMHIAKALLDWYLQ